MKLISMTDLVLEQYEICTDVPTQKEAIAHFLNCKKYAEFLKQPLTLGMFVPCDENGNVLSELKLKSELQYDIIDFQNKLIAYNEAKERVLFEGFEYEEVNIMGAILKLKSVFICMAEDLKNSKAIIEDLIEYRRDYELTESAIKQIFG